jgi:hypothetical protein
MFKVGQCSDSIRRMANRAAQSIVDQATALARSHSHAPAIDLLDLVMQGQINQVLDFSDTSSVNGSLASPGAQFGQLLAAAFDEVMTPNGWSAFTGPMAEVPLRDACLRIWRTNVVPRFGARHGAVITGLP